MDPEHEDEDQNQEDIEEPTDDESSESDETEDIEALQDRLNAVEGELAHARAELLERDEQVERLQAELGVVLERYRTTLLASNPDVPADLVEGTSMEALDASFNQAAALVERLRRQIEERTAQERVPAGAPTRRSLDVSALTPQQKIMQGLALHR